jgi:peptidoglycan-associated lipoprotein
MRVLPFVAVLASVVLLAGCPKKPTTVPEAGAGSTVPSQAEGATTGGAAVDEGVGAARPLPGAEGTTGTGATAGMTDADRIIYFDYDSSEIKPQYAETITALARRLAANPAFRIRLEGHTDERGSREYNIALGERRAQAVRRALLLQGAGDAQVATVSYGEERPAVEGSDEAAYEKNRRVEIVEAG